MSTIAKTVVATGVSSGLGLEAIKQLLQQSQPYKIILGARNTARTEAAYSDLKYDRSANSVSILPCELSNLKDVKSFSQKVLEKVGQDKIDYVLLNAGISDKAGPSTHGSKWCDTLVVNHYAQFYLLHLLREKLEVSNPRIVFVSSGGVRNVPDPSVMDKELLADAGTDKAPVYCQAKFVQLLGAHWWRRQLQNKATVVAVSPGLIPGTGLGGGLPEHVKKHPDAKSVPEGGENVVRVMFREDIPEDPEQIFLTSWGEWWPKDVYGLSLDKALQDKWCPSKEQLEKDEGLTA